MATENQKKKRRLKPEDEPVTRGDHYGDSEPAHLVEEPSSSSDTVTTKDHYGDSEPAN